MAKEISTIHFHYLCKPFYFPTRTKLKFYLKLLAKKKGHTIDNINYIFCTDEYLLQMNQAHLRHDTYTDIITFQLNNVGDSLLSDIYISIDRVRDNASILNIPFTHELHRVIFHGMLHLCGYKDKSKADSLLMRQQEDIALNGYFVSRGTL